MKQSKFIFYITLLSFMASCGPKNSLDTVEVDREQMRSILTDIYILEGARVSNMEAYGKDTSKFTQAYSEIYSKHDITQEEFKIAYQAYADERKVLMQIFEDVLEDLSKLKEEVRSSPGHVEKTDSVAPVKPPKKRMGDL